MTNFPSLTRRSLMRMGSLAICGYEVAPFSPSNVKAQGRVTARSSARSVILLNLLGGPSPMDMFDVKAGKWAPENRDVRTTHHGYQFPYGLMPKLAEHLGSLAIVRSAQAWDTVHSRGQYYLQTGHPVSPARIKEAPSIGSVIAYEAMQNRRSSDFLPPFISMNYSASGMYGPLIGEGCLPSDCAPLTLDLRDRNLPFVVEQANQERFSRRWDVLNSLDTSRRSLDESSPQVMRQFESFGRAVYKMMKNPAISSMMELREDERKAYGATPFGDACIIARNMVAADAGARFLLVTQPGWDHHGNIYGKDGKGGIYQTCRDLDNAFAALLHDLKILKSADGKPLLDSTLVLCMGEFGRTPGELTPLAGREHYADTMFAVFAGAGVKGGRAIGATDEQCAKITEFGWSSKRPVYPEDICATIYSDTEGVSQLVPVSIWNYGLASFDRTHTFKLNWIWDVPRAPVGRQRRASGHRILHRRSGRYHRNPSQGARVDVIGNPVWPKGERTFSRNFRTDMFRLPAAGTFGTAARTLIRGPGINNWDIAAFKSFPIRENMRLQLRVETYNTFNHTQFTSLDTTARFDAAGNQVNTRLGEFTAARNPRQIQFALRFYF